MSQRFFEVRGQLVNASGEPIRDLLVSILDSDKVADDLIGVGTPMNDGRFCVSFTREAFNQDWFENEDLPDLYVVVSTIGDDGVPEAIFQRDFPGLRFEGGNEDLGRIEIDTTSPATTVKGSVFYDFSNVRRVDVDDEVIAHVLDAVVGRVESVTGWKGIAEGIPVKQTVQLLEVISEITAGAIGSEQALPWWTDMHQRVQQTVLGGMVAVYDPFAEDIWLDRNLLGQAGLDIMKASVAHELVHAGQFRQHPALVEAYRRSLVAHDLRLRYSTRDDASEGIPSELTRELLPAFAFMCNLEGYARYVEAQFFRTTHTAQRYVPQIRMGLLLGSVPVLTAARFSAPAMHAAVASPDASDEEKATAWLTSLDAVAYKAEQYGCDEWYKSRQKSDDPVAFLPNLGQEVLPALIKWAASAWDKKRAEDSA